MGAWAGAVLLLAGGCASAPRPGAAEPRRGDEIVVAGQFFHTGTPVVLWMDPGGYDGYRVERRFSPWARAGWAESKVDTPALDSPNRYGVRAQRLSAEELERVRGGGWDLPLLQRVVDQFVLHYDAVGVSRETFKRLHDDRGLSVHFMLDLDGTIYQTIDVKERAWHATKANSRSVGIEIAHIGAYPPESVRAAAAQAAIEAGKKPAPDEVAQWYQPDGDGGVRIAIPAKLGAASQRTPDFGGRPARPEPITGTIHGEVLEQYDFTPEQYAALIKLTATLTEIFPAMKLDYPRDADGKLVTTVLADEAYEAFGGVLAHYHVQRNKIDPGPAFDWDRVIEGARKLKRSRK